MFLFAYPCPDLGQSYWERTLLGRFMLKSVSCDCMIRGTKLGHGKGMRRGGGSKQDQHLQRSCSECRNSVVRFLV
eukprot:362754-Chlamydomonas_euryale.AAC.6